MRLQRRIIVGLLAIALVGWQSVSDVFAVGVIGVDVPLEGEVRASVFPEDTYFGQQEYLNNLSAPDAWNLTTGSSDVTIAVLDSGVDIFNPDLAPNVWTNTREIPENGIDDDANGFIDDIHGWDFVRETNDVRPKFDTENWSEVAMHHGTIVAGIAAARGGNNIGIAGVAWHPKIMALRVLDSSGVGNTATVARAIDYARNNGANVINLSFVGSESSNTLLLAVERAYNAGKVIVAAAGNEVKEGMNLDHRPEYPICLIGLGKRDYVLGVAAVDAHQKLASFSNFGSSCIDVVAVGVRLYSTHFRTIEKEGFEKQWGGWWTGTSVAAPQVSGAVALLLSIDPTLTPDMVRSILQQTADSVDASNPGKEGLLGAGQVNLRRALALAESRRQAQPTISAVSTSRYGVFTTAESAGTAEVRLFHQPSSVQSFFAFNKLWNGAVSVAGAIQNGGFVVATAPLQNAGPEVRVWDDHLKLISRFFAYDYQFLGGVRVALGDVDGDGVKDIVTVPASRGGPHVRMFDLSGKLLHDFFIDAGYPRGGFTIAAADITGNGKDEIIVGTGPGVEPRVFVYDQFGNNLTTIPVFVPQFRGGVRVAAGDIDGDGRAEIVVAAGPGGGPQVQVWNSAGKLVRQWFAYAKQFRGGVHVAVGDYDGSGRYAIITGAGSGGGPHVRVFDNTGNVQAQWFSFDAQFRNGVQVAAIR